MTIFRARCCFRCSVPVTIPGWQFSLPVVVMTWVPALGRIQEAPPKVWEMASILIYVPRVMLPRAVTK